MRLRANVDILAEGKKVKAGGVAEFGDAAGKDLIRMGWADELPAEEKKAPAKQTRKKAGKTNA